LQNLTLKNRYDFKFSSETDQQIKEEFKKFFIIGNNILQLYSLLDGIYEENLKKTVIKTLRNVKFGLQQITDFEIPYSSLLIVYDAKYFLEHPNEDLKENEGRVLIKVIDFAYYEKSILSQDQLELINTTESKNYEKTMLFSLENIINLLLSL
jgi:hypothetical protein